MLDVVALGELLIDFTENGLSANNQRLFEQNPGGAVANVVCAAAKLGLKTGFIGKVGNDMHGHFLKKTLDEASVDTSGLIVADDVFTTLAFVSLSSNGEREFSFARKPGADTCIRIDELNQDVIKNSRIFHVGSLSMTDEPARGTTVEAIRIAKAAGAIISYDPNYREKLWKNVDDAKKHMRTLLPMADLIKISDEETELLTDMKEPQKALDVLLSNGAIAAVVTLGKKGAMVGYKDARISVPTFESGKVVDTTGAGDSFWGAFLYRILSGVSISELSAEILEEYTTFANASATLCVSKRGAIPAMPDAKSVYELIATEKR